MMAIHIGDGRDRFDDPKLERGEGSDGDWTGPSGDFSNAGGVSGEAGKDAPNAVMINSTGSSSGIAENSRPTLFLVSARRHAERGQFELTGRYVDEFLTLVDFLPKRSELPELLYIADRIFSAGKHTIALTIYELAANAGIVHPIGAVRQAEHLLALGKYEQGYVLFNGIESSLDAWGDCVRGSLLCKLFRFSDAAKIFQKICTSHGDIGHFWERWFSWCVTQDETGAQSVAFFENVARIRPDLLQYFQYRTLVKAGSVEEAAQMMLASAEVKQHVTLWDVVPLLYLFVTPNPSGSFSAIADFALDRFHTKSSIYKPLIDRACLLRDWQEAHKLISRAEEMGLVAGDFELGIKEFELACFTGNRDSALRLFREFKIAELPSRYVAPFYRFMADAGSFSDIVDDFLTRLRDLNELPKVDSIVVRSVRRTQRYEDLLKALTWRLSQVAKGSVNELLIVLLQDWIFCHSDSLTVANRLDLVRSLRSSASDSVKRRIDVELSISEARSGEFGNGQKEVAVYFCTNLTYLCGAATAIFSLLLNNQKLAAAADFYVVAESKDEAFVVKVLEPIADFFGVEISVVNEDVIVGSDVALREEYGIFTGGVTLASAAYYRIYFARYLDSLKRYKKALYIDSDVVVNSGLERVLDLDLNGFPICARREVDKPEVRAAVEQHGLKNGSYFNSGVLLFDFTAPDLQDCLFKSVRAAEDRNISLVFQDQCALNIGFADRSLSLDEAFNYFVDPHFDNCSFEEAYFAYVVHFLDRPKPWDSLYSRSIGFLWLHQWQKLSTILPAEISFALYASAARS